MGEAGKRSTKERIHPQVCGRKCGKDKMSVSGHGERFAGVSADSVMKALTMSS